MAEYTYVVCDFCSPGESPVDLAKRGQGRGWVAGNEGFAVGALGWKKVPAPAPYSDDFRVMCPECQEDSESHG